MARRQQIRTIACAALAGLCIGASVPPWGWWPLAFVGIALVDRLLADQPPRARFKRMALVAACWLYPTTVWMLDLSAPGYVVAQAIYASMFGVAAIAVPPGRGRRVALPGMFVLAEWLRWSWPFGGVPLSTLAMGQADSPLAPTVRTLGPLLLVALVAAIGVGISAAVAREWRAPVIVLAIVILAMGWASIAPDGYSLRSIDAAVVQGGGKQRTRADAAENRAVLQRHVDASELIEPPVDLVLWPENVVNPWPPYEQVPGPRFLSYDEAERAVQGVAERLHTTLLPGWFYAIDDDSTVNYTSVVDANGQELDRFEKVRTVPFGEFVPLRWLIEPFAEEALPPRDVQPGTEPAVLDTPVGPVGVAISWEIFFDTRARDGIGHGGQILLNPTNGSSYWLSIVQTQQIASSRLRALETGRFVLQAAPTGFSAIIEPDGTVRSRTSIGEQAVLQDTVEMRGGETIAVRVGRWPMLAIAVLLLLLAHALSSERRPWRQSSIPGASANRRDRRETSDLEDVGTERL